MIGFVFREHVSLENRYTISIRNVIHRHKIKKIAQGKNERNVNIVRNISHFSIVNFF